MNRSNACDLVVLEEALDTGLSRIVEPPMDNKGDVFEVFDGAQPPEGGLFLLRTDDKPLPDFLFSIGRTLIVSQRAWAFMELADTGGATIHDVTVFSLSGEELGDYFWVNFVHRFPVMDRQQSVYSLSKRGFFTSIDFFRVQESAVPVHGAFREDAVGLILFHREKANEILRRGFSGGSWRPLNKYSWP